MYKTTVLTARCYAERGYATVTFRRFFHTGWNTSKIISRPNNLSIPARTESSSSSTKFLM